MLEPGGVVWGGGTHYISEGREGHANQGNLIFRASRNVSSLKCCEGTPGRRQS